MAFTDHLDIETFRTFGTMAPSLGRDALQRADIDPRMLSHLVDLRDAHRIHRIEGTENRDIRFADVWNAFLDDTETAWGHILPSGLSSFVLTHAISARVRIENHGIDVDDAYAEAYDLLCSRMDEGLLVGVTLHPVVKPKPYFDDLRCGVTGERCRLVVEDWKPRLERFDREARAVGCWVPMEPVERPGVQTLEIDLPTGTLLVSDYLRAPGVHDALEARIDDAIGDQRYGEAYSVSSERGRIATTRAIAEAASVLQVSTTNTSVSIHVTDDRLVAVDGSSSRVAGMRRIADVSCDRWTILLADRARVLELMKDDGTVLDRFLASTECDVSIVTVSPGRWRVSFGEDLAQPEEATALGIETRARIWFAMERLC